MLITEKFGSRIHLGDPILTNMPLIPDKPLDIGFVTLSAYGSGNFINVLHEHLRNHEKVLTSRVNSKDDIYDSIKTFFGKGH